MAASAEIGADPRGVFGASLNAANGELTPGRLGLPDALSTERAYVAESKRRMEENLSSKLHWIGRYEKTGGLKSDRFELAAGTARSDEILQQWRANEANQRALGSLRTNFSGWNKWSTICSEATPPRDPLPDSQTGAGWKAFQTDVGVACAVVSLDTEATGTKAVHHMINGITFVLCVLNDFTPNDDPGWLGTRVRQALEAENRTRSHAPHQMEALLPEQAESVLAVWGKSDEAPKRMFAHALMAGWQLFNRKSCMLRMCVHRTVDGQAPGESTRRWYWYTRKNKAHLSDVPYTVDTEQPTRCVWQNLLAVREITGPTPWFLCNVKKYRKTNKYVLDKSKPMSPHWYEKLFLEALEAGGVPKEKLVVPPPDPVTGRKRRRAMNTQSARAGAASQYRVAGVDDDITTARGAWAQKRTMLTYSRRDEDKHKEAHQSLWK